MRFGPQYPHPTTPTLTWLFILPRDRGLVYELCPSARSRFTNLRNENGNCLQNYLNIQPKGLVPHIGDVEIDHLIERGLILAADLPKPCESRQGPEPFLLPGRIVLGFIRNTGPGSNQAHVSAQDVDELRQLIQPRRTQQCSEWNQARVAIDIHFRHWCATVRRHQPSWSETLNKQRCARPNLRAPGETKSDRGMRA